MWENVYFTFQFLIFPHFLNNTSKSGVCTCSSEKNMGFWDTRWKLVRKKYLKVRGMIVILGSSTKITRWQVEPSDGLNSPISHFCLLPTPCSSPLFLEALFLTPVSFLSPFLSPVSFLSHIFLIPVSLPRPVSHPCLLNDSLLSPVSL